MSYHFTANMIPLVIAALISGALGLYTWQNRRAIGAIPFSIMMLIVYEWEISYIFQLAGIDLATKAFWDKAMYIGVVFTPVAWLAFALEYTGRKTWMNARRLAMFSVLPVCTIIIIFTNESHGLFWAHQTLSTQGGFILTDNINGPYFWIHAAYSYTLIMIGLILIVRALLRWPAQYRGQMIWVLLATLTPFIANIISVFHIVNVLIDLTPFAFTVTGIGMAFALFRYRLLDIAPIARDIVIEGMKEGMVILDAGRRVIDINRAAQHMIGLSSDQQMIGKPVAEVFARWPELVERFRSVVEGEQEVSDGEGEKQRWYELTFSTLFDENKTMIGRVIMGRDITDRKQAERRLQESEARFRLIVENASDLIFGMDIHGCITYANPAVLRALGYEKEVDVLGREYLDLVTPEMRHKTKRIYQHQLVSKTSNTYNEVPAVAMDGREIWIGLSVQLIQEAGQVTGFQALGRDITAIKQAYDAMLIARDQALEASLAKTQLLSKVSHELRSPLGSILGYAELLEQSAFGQLNEKQKKAASEIIESSKYLASMVNELLDEAQLRANTTTLQQNLFALRSLIEHATSGMDILAQKKGLEFSSYLDPSLPQEIYGDSRRIRQIIINLVNNAIKFTREGRVSLRAWCPNGSCLEIQVSDTGVGIPKEAHSQIFEPFRQVHPDITHENRGAGLGLSIAKQLVDLMNGKITLESELGKGSTFTVLLPLRKAD